MKAAFPIDNFLAKAAQDEQLLPTHLSLFMAIFYYSPAEKPHQEFRVTRRNLMRFSKVRSKSTYHKCMQDLLRLGYISYEPSFDTYLASSISII